MFCAIFIYTYCVNKPTSSQFLPPNCTCFYWKKLPSLLFFSFPRTNQPVFSFYLIFLYFIGANLSVFPFAKTKHLVFTWLFTGFYCRWAPSFSLTFSLFLFEQEAVEDNINHLLRSKAQVPTEVISSQVSAWLGGERGSLVDLRMICNMSSS
jgi:hypothetical protein